MSSTVIASLLGQVRVSDQCTAPQRGTCLRTPGLFTLLSPSPGCDRDCLYRGRATAPLCAVLVCSVRPGGQQSFRSQVRFARASSLPPGCALTRFAHSDYWLSDETTTLWIFSNFQYIACAIAFAIGYPFRREIWHNCTRSALDPLFRPSDR